MKTSFYLVITDTGVVKTTKSKPALKWNEIAIFHTVELPDLLFKKPQLTAQLIVPESSVQPHSISVVFFMKVTPHKLGGDQIILTSSAFHKSFWMKQFNLTEEEFEKLIVK